MRLLPALTLVCFFTACHSPEATPHAKQPAPSANVEAQSAPSPAAAPLTLAALQQRAKAFGAVISLPTFETTPEAVFASVSNTIQSADAALDTIGQRAPAQMNFTNTVNALDDIAYEAGLTGNRLALIKETSANAAVRDTATEALKRFQEWAVGLDYREDIYRAVQRVAGRKPALSGEDEKFLHETLRDYRRAGLQLPKARRDEVERERKELANLQTDFESNVNKARSPLKFNRAELEGVPEDFLNQPGLKTGPEEYTLSPNVTFQYQIVMENAKREATRRKMAIARFTLARTENAKLLQQILELRQRIAAQLGYASWADYVIEPKMARTAKNAIAFCENLRAGLQPKFDAEVREFARLKARDTGDPSALIHIWDTAYYSNQLKKEKYNVDAEQLRVFFPYQAVLDGMFHIFDRIFGVVITPVDPGAKWVEDLQMYAVVDTASGEPLGLFYLDMFPREGKYNHFAQFGIIEGKRLPDGQYQRPTVALVCNFPTPQPGKPSLLSHSDVETLFHEFGHAMHSILTRANYARYSGTSVPRDFVEAPSQMLENWVWDKKVLDSFAADYRNPTNKIPERVLNQLKAAKLSTSGTFYRRQMSFALTDLALHTQVKPGVDAIKLSNKVLGEVFLSMPDDTTFVTYFGHLMGYDAAYYGYGWADAIAADLATKFEQARDGYFDAEMGRQLRREIYEPGDSRDVRVSIEKFLGRPQSIEPFLESVGIKTKPATINAAPVVGQP